MDFSYYKFIFISVHSHIGHNRDVIVERVREEYLLTKSFNCSKAKTSNSENKMQWEKNN